MQKPIAHQGFLPVSFKGRHIYSSVKHYSGEEKRTKKVVLDLKRPIGWGLLCLGFSLSDLPCLLSSLLSWQPLLPMSSAAGLPRVGGVGGSLLAGVESGLALLYVLPAVRHSNLSFCPAPFPSQSPVASEECVHLCI